MISTDVLILGAGLAGLSTAYHLDRLGRGTRYLLAEKESSPGGRAGSVHSEGFTFDHTGHLLHLHDPYGKRLIMGLLRANLALHARSSWIYSHGAYTRYPFQANTYGLPARVVEECVAGFVKNVYRPRAAGPKPSFEEWCLRAFGEGISRHFMFPYNRRLWRTALSRMTTEWQGRFLPEPSPVEVLYGALSDQKKFFGYNAYFRYPKRGGIQALPDALAARVSDLRLGCRASSVDLRERVAVIEGLGEVRYQRLVSTLPLTELLDLSTPLPRDVRDARRRLRWVRVHNLNLGVRRPRVSDKHWIYFPEDRFPFYRAGVASNFARDLAPPGTSSFYLEVSRRPDEPPVDRDRLERRCLEGLRACGLLKPSDKLAARVWIDIPCAYVIYDRERTPAVKRVMAFLDRQGVQSIGRWGGWKYSFMEETILDGKRCAERLLGKTLAPETDPGRGKLVALK